MRFLFVDAENIGLKEVESIEATISDKVFVFSKNEAIKQACEQNLFLFISSYPTAPNQADFYIIGNLIRTIVLLTKQQKINCEFILYSRDTSLTTAFSFQCKLHKVKHKIALKPKSPDNSIKITQEKTLDQKILQLLKNPTASETVRKELKIPKPDFTRAMNTLIKDKKIQRSPNSKKNWIQTNFM